MRSFPRPHIGEIPYRPGLARGATRGLIGLGRAAVAAGYEVRCFTRSTSSPIMAELVHPEFVIGPVSLLTYLMYWSMVV